MKDYRVAAVAGLSLALASVVVAAPASAQSEFSGQVFSCSASSDMTVRVVSNAKGRVTHSVGVTTLGSWNNGSTYQVRAVNSWQKSVASWRTYLTGVGGDIQIGYAGCANF